jgi:hypothetical protein
MRTSELKSEALDLASLWSASDVAPSFAIMRHTKTLYGLDDIRNRPFFYTPVYVLFDCIEAVRALTQATAEALAPLIYTSEVDAALAALSAAHRSVASLLGHFPGPEVSFFNIVTAMRAKVGDARGKNTIHTIAHAYNVVHQRTYLTLFGVRVSFYECVKNRYGRSGELVLATPEVREHLSRNGLVIEDPLTQEGGEAP